jgi:hypothetical protein
MRRRTALVFTALVAAGGWARSAAADDPINVALAEQWKAKLRVARTLKLLHAQKSWFGDPAGTPSTETTTVSGDFVLTCDTPDGFRIRKGACAFDKAFLVALEAGGRTSEYKTLSAKTLSITDSSFVIDAATPGPVKRWVNEHMSTWLVDALLAALQPATAQKPGNSWSPDGLTLAAILGWDTTVSITASATLKSDSTAAKYVVEFEAKGTLAGVQWQSGGQEILKGAITVEGDKKALSMSLVLPKSQAPDIGGSKFHLQIDRSWTLLSGTTP